MDQNDVAGPSSSRPRRERKLSPKAAEAKEAGIALHMPSEPRDALMPSADPTPEVLPGKKDVPISMGPNAPQMERGSSLKSDEAQAPTKKIRLAEQPDSQTLRRSKRIAEAQATETIANGTRKRTRDNGVHEDSPRLKLARSGPGLVAFNLLIDEVVRVLSKTGEFVFSGHGDPPEVVALEGLDALKEREQLDKLCGQYAAEEIAAH